ncbi:hypothetical protein [Sphingomonas montanisoli]|uniref:hypothetical protein n=1 Tax=Sphingomonas montanisoli TaxID=2606412 RepID=UPI003CCC8B7E
MSTTITTALAATLALTIASGAIAAPAAAPTEKCYGVSLAGKTAVIAIFVYSDAWPTHLSWLGCCSRRSRGAAERGLWTKQRNEFSARTPAKPNGHSIRFSGTGQSEGASRTNHIILKAVVAPGI